ncbi:MAG TPA: hypothetical protein EYN91_04265 [Candidatus Melainabacteria bacterium]|nr:hypothetical protein [Candidatus Melainabacteria bacterium]HIN66157.1 hypothetical protein [Candidatus Obscuribacterales bacterium]
MDFTMSEEERSQLVGRYAHHWCDLLHRVMDDIKHTHLVEYLRRKGVELEKHIKEVDNTEHWIFKMKDNFVYLDSQGKPTEKCVPMTVSFYGQMHVRANAQNILDCIVRLARGTERTPMEVSADIMGVRFAREPEIEEDETEEVAPSPIIHTPLPAQPAKKPDPLTGVKAKG